MECAEVASGLRFPEGPVWLKDGSVLVTEIASGDLTRVLPDGRLSRVAHMGGGPNGAAIGPDGRCYVCNNGGMKFREQDGLLQPGLATHDYSGGWIEAVDLSNGAREILYTSHGDQKLSAPNDLVFDSHGGFYFTDSGKLFRQSRHRGALFYARADGTELNRVIFPMEVPNGVGLSPDGQTLYVAETLTARLWAFDLVSPGVIRKGLGPVPWEHGRLVFARSSYALFDSLAVDGKGNICLTEIPAGKVVVVSPTGQLVEEYCFADPFTTNLCFGGTDLCAAFVTLSSSGRLVTVRWPHAGLRLSY